VLAAADSEGASFSTIPEYVQWITKACGDPATSNSEGCAALKDKLCGTRDTSEVQSPLRRLWPEALNGNLGLSCLRLCRSEMGCMQLQAYRIACSYSAPHMSSQKTAGTALMLHRYQHMQQLLHKCAAFD
jgi:hypothetical protein